MGGRALRTTASISPRDPDCQAFRRLHTHFFAIRADMVTVHWFLVGFSGQACEGELLREIDQALRQPWASGGFFVFEEYERLTPSLVLNPLPPLCQRHVVVVEPAQTQVAPVRRRHERH